MNRKLFFLIRNAANDWSLSPCNTKLCPVCCVTDPLNFADRRPLNGREGQGEAGRRQAMPGDKSGLNWVVQLSDAWHKIKKSLIRSNTAEYFQSM